MKLGPKSRDLLELLSILGMEAVEGLFLLPSLYKSVSGSSDRAFHRRAQSLHEKGWITWNHDSINGNWAAKLTEDGHVKLNAQIDPETCWNEIWDGKWRVLTFDLPQHATRERQALRSWLQIHRFGLLQGSVWITPRDLGDWTVELARLKVKPSSAISMKGDFQGNRSSDDYVRRAWNFTEINRNYRHHSDFLSNSPPPSKDTFPAWFQQELAMWRTAFDADPFLPKQLWPKGFAKTYLAPAALKARTETYRKLAHALR